MEDLLKLLIMGIPLFFAIIIHEIAHGYTAYFLGDNTAKRMGRLSLNPIRHVDLLGTILFPMLLFISNSSFLFGWAKPVPVNFYALKDGKKDMGLVALSGPLSNFLMALFFVIIYKVNLNGEMVWSPWLTQMGQYGIMINLVLCALNLFPILPLDGGRILISILPQKYAIEFMKTEKYGLYLIIGLLFFLPFLSELLNLNLDIFGMYMNWMISGFERIINFIFKGV